MVTKHRKYKMPRGELWTSEEEEKLLQSLADGKSTAQISREHDRTPGSIKSRVRRIAVQMIGNGKTIEEVCNVLPITPDMIQRAMTQRQVIDNESIREMLIRIEEKLDRLLNK
tara:strand:+ start:102 stop:440 length:339 start_codon:yes stop_codon:yes gene_type:complete